MATSLSFINYVCEQLEGIGNIRYRKMFGEYLIYINEKPIVVVCNDTVYVKKVDFICDQMKDAKIGYPYKNAKEHFILDIDNSEFSKLIVSEIEKITPIPKKKKQSN